MEDLASFENFLKKIDIEYSALSNTNVLKDCILVDRFGILEAIYSISSMVFVGGSVHVKLKGHNPIEPVIYGNLVFCGKYMSSFEYEVEYLKSLGCLFQIDNVDDLKTYILKFIDRRNINFDKKKEEIKNCYKIVLSRLTQV